MRQAEFDLAYFGTFAVLLYPLMFFAVAVAVGRLPAAIGVSGRASSSASSRSFSGGSDFFGFVVFEGWFFDVCCFLEVWYWKCVF